ncbi:MAG: PepSY domain-containing protein, partial [Vicinamibacterales bacterium]
PLVSLDLNDLWSRAEAHQPSWRTITLRMPASSGAPVAFTIDEGGGGEPHKRGTLTLDARTGAVVKWEPFSQLSTGRQIRSILRFAHTGEVAGLVGQTIAGIASATACVMVATGFALTWRRWMAWRGRRRAEPGLEKAA